HSSGPSCLLLLSLPVYLLLLAAPVYPLLLVDLPRLESFPPPRSPELPQDRLGLLDLYLLVGLFHPEYLVHPDLLEDQLLLVDLVVQFLLAGPVGTLHPSDRAGPRDRLGLFLLGCLALPEGQLPLMGLE